MEGPDVCATLPQAATELSDHDMAAFPFTGMGASDIHLRHVPLSSGQEHIPEIEIKLEFSDEEEERAEWQKGGTLGLAAAYREGSHEKRKAELFPQGPGSQSRVTEDWLDPGSVRGMNQALQEGWAVRHTMPPAFHRTRHRKTTSEVWQFFSPDSRNPCRAVCLLCKASIGRGRLRGHCNTSTLKRHLEGKHPLEWKRRERAGGRTQGEEKEKEGELMARGFHRFKTRHALGSSTQPLSGVPHGAPHFLSMVSESSEEEGQGRAGTTDSDFFLESSDEESSESRRVAELLPRGRGRGRKGRAKAEQPKMGLTTPYLEMLVGPADPRARRLSFSNHPPVPLGTRHRRSTSAVWRFFYVDHSNISQAICTLCQASISRGKLGSHLGTSALKRHLEGKHPLEWRQGRAAGAPAPSQSSTQAEGLSGGQAEDEDDEPMEDVILTSPAVLGCPKSPCTSPGGSTAPVSDSHEIKAPAGHKEKALPPTAVPLIPSRTHAALTERGRDVTGKYTPSHPQAQAWHRSITELLCGMALPCSFVSAKPFHRFMAQVDPRYRVPSPAFFSRKAVPHLCQAVGLGIALELQQAQVSHVHLSARVWAHGPATEHLVLAAHWLTPRSALVMHPSCSRHRHAVLCVRALRKEQAVTDLQRVLAEQVQLWLAPSSLSPGFLVSGGSPSVERAVKDSGHIHLPCFVHRLNQLVQAFLDHHHSIEGTLGMARAICTHFGCSPEARRGLEELQRQQGLAPRQLKQEATTSWVSTFYMLERLLELQPAVQEYVDKQQFGDTGLALGASQWKLLGNLVALLQPFEMAVREASVAHALLSQVLPQLRYLHIFLRQICQHFQSQGGEEAGSAVCLAESLALQLSTDPWLSEMFNRQEYVLATLLDPRFKGKIDAILPPGSSLDHWKQLLVRKVKDLLASAASCPASSGDVHPITDVVHSQEAQRGPRQPHGACGLGRRASVVPPLIRKEKTLIEQLESVGLLASKDCGASLPTESNSASVMVDRYLCDSQTVGAQDDVLGYWEKRQWLWPALAKLASFYLSCPPSGAFLERILSAPDSPFSAERHLPEGESLESLIFLRANLGNIPSYPPLPLICSDEDSAATSSEEERSWPA